MAKRAEYSEIKRLLSVIFSGILCAGLVALVFTVYYGPSGTNIAGNVILSAESLENLRYKDASEDNKVFVLDKIEFNFFDRNEKKWNTVPVHLDTYTEFYEMVADDPMVNNAEGFRDVESFLAQGPIGSLIVTVKPEKDAFSQRKIMQEILFMKVGNDYQVTFLNHERKFFFHRQIFYKVLDLFLNREGKNHLFLLKG